MLIGVSLTLTVFAMRHHASTVYAIVVYLSVCIIILKVRTNRYQ